MENNIGELTKFLRGAIITMLYNSVIKRGLKMSNEEKTTLQMILSAAIQEFLEKGFTSASLRNIAKKAGVTSGALYGYYWNDFARLKKNLLKFRQKNNLTILLLLPANVCMKCSCMPMNT